MTESGLRESGGRRRRERGAGEVRAPAEARRIDFRAKAQGGLALEGRFDLTLQSSSGEEESVARSICSINPAGMAAM